MEYFDLDGLKNYQLVSRTAYKGGSPESNWFYDTRDKLKYLIKLLSEKTGNEYKLVYTEKPNGQAGPGMISFKDYVLAGFSITSEFSDDLFMKVAISNIKESPVFDLNIDMNFKKKSSYFQDRREYIFKTSYKEWDIDSDFPKDWQGLLELIIDSFKNLEIAFKKYLLEIQGINSMDNLQNINSTINLLKYKKQIILQGPPGTGKTKAAIEIADGLMEQNFKNGHFVDDDFLKIKINDVLKTPFDGSLFAITEVKRDEQFFMVKPYNAKNTYKVTYEQIYKCLNAKGWNDGSDKWNNSGNGPYLVAIAKEIVILKKKELKEKCCSIIQFHPSYTYEDFVRGIVAKQSDEGEGVVYVSENKILAKFAKLALHNFEYVNVDSKNITIDNPDVFESFIEDLKDKIGQSENHKYPITEAVYLFSADETRFKYKGDNWVAHYKGLNMKFSELKKIIDSGAVERQDIKMLDDIEELTKQHASYFIKVVEKYHQYKASHPINKPVSEKKSLQNYVLIIDEINRANLSSVLGELIYALEYRGKKVDSMYEVEGSNQIVLPPNLYIIGTMNTADRSVGHIDYAIRRRFAFVDVLPKDLTKEDGIEFKEGIFKQVTSLFIKNYDADIDYSSDTAIIEKSAHLTADFEPKDVWLGHSYFIQQYEKDQKGNDDSSKPIDFSLRIKYEIKPILEEYIKDGILKETARDIIKNLA